MLARFIQLGRDLTAFGAEALVILVGALLVTWVGSTVVGGLLTPFTRQLRNLPTTSTDPSPLRGFRNGGRYIGLLERLLIYLFVLCEQIAGVGFLVAAKSIFRFGELSDQQNRLEAEYITIGTLLSFAWGLSISLLTKLILNAL